jgi:hypothetical protein
VHKNRKIGYKVDDIAIIYNSQKLLNINILKYVYISVDMVICHGKLSLSRREGV